MNNKKWDNRWSLYYWLTEIGLKETAVNIYYHQIPAAWRNLNGEDD